jgi:lipopolysaccharide transport system ATP-binding protein
MSETLIVCEKVGKKFCRDLKKSLWYGIKDSVANLFGLKQRAEKNTPNSPVTAIAELRPGEFWANKDITFEVKRGECLGLLGRNGAGKTTLLKMLSGLLKPDRGRIEIRGRVGGLIALGAGFNPILTGRENICINASVLGLSRRQTADRLDDIVEFSELGEFIDTPVRNYSSGMQVRLGFAAATVLDPDVLILDEVLAVGDAAFRHKCYRRMDELRERSAVVFVSHDMPSVARICSSAVLLRSGQIELHGPPGEAIRKYNDLNHLENPVAPTISCFPPIISIDVVDFPKTIRFTEPFSAKLLIHTRTTLANFGVMIHAKDASDQYLASHMLSPEENSCVLQAGENCCEMNFASMPLRPGKYRLSVGITDVSGQLLAVWANGLEFETTGGSIACVATCQLNVGLNKPPTNLTHPLGVKSGAAQ